MGARLLVMGAVGAVLCSAAASADDHDEGRRVRVELVEGAQQQPTFPAVSRDALHDRCGDRCRSFTGRLLEARQGTLTVSLDRQRSVTLPPGSVARLEISDGRRSRGGGAARGAGFGLLTGAVIGGLIGYASGDDECSSVDRGQLFSCFLLFSRGDKAAMGAVGLGAIGFVAGAVAGAVSPGEYWRRAPDLADKSHVSLSVKPLRRRGVAAAVSVSF